MTPKLRSTLPWLFVTTLFVMCGVLGVLQYRWIGEVSVAARERLQGSLQTSLNRVSQDFNLRIARACRTLMPSSGAASVEEAGNEFAAHYAQWKRGSQGRMFRGFAVAIPKDGALALQRFDSRSGVFVAAAWPAEWEHLKARLEAHVGARMGMSGFSMGPAEADEGTVFEIPVFADVPRQDGPPMPGREEREWFLFDLDPAYARDALLPELIQRYVPPDYQVEVVARADPSSIVYKTGSDESIGMERNADASASLFAPQYGRIFGGRPMPGGEGPRFEQPESPRGPETRTDPGPGFGPPNGRWRIFVRHRAGSLEAAVSKARWRNMAVTGGVLMLILASMAALVRYTRRAQRLAELQMDFVAGVSHELRTPLTVIHTAAYNLRGRLAHDPAQVERYGELIQKESGRLKEIVEQILKFARTHNGHIAQNREAVSVEGLIEESLASNRSLVQESLCIIEKYIDPGLPLVLGDPVALKQVIENLLNNAVKYGKTGGWIGMFATRAEAKGQEGIEIRVEDRGPGIPSDEQEHIFEPFFRGRRALQNQVHGTGLGLNLVKKIAEAHGGHIRVASEVTRGAEFIVWIPAAPQEVQDEFAHSFDRG